MRRTAEAKSRYKSEGSGQPLWRRAAARCTLVRSERCRYVCVAHRRRRGNSSEAAAREGDRTSPLPALRHLSGSRLLIRNLTGGHVPRRWRDPRQTSAVARPTYARLRAQKQDGRPAAKRRALHVRQRGGGGQSAAGREAALMKMRTRSVTPVGECLWSLVPVPVGPGRPGSYQI